MPRSMTMCHGQLNSTDFRSLASAAGVYSFGGGPPNCAYTATDAESREAGGERDAG